MAVRYTDDSIRRALRTNRGMVHLAAKELGCNPDVIKRRIKSTPSVRYVFEDERGRFVDYAELKLYEAVTRGEPWAVTLVLKTLGRERGYVDRTEHEVNIKAIEIIEVERPRLLTAPATDTYQLTDGTYHVEEEDSGLAKTA